MNRLCPRFPLHFTRGEAKWRTSRRGTGVTRIRLSFKEMCERFDVTPRTLRYYESIELLFPEKVGRSRYYGPTELVRMKLILRGRKFGFSLEEIRQWLLIYDQEGTDLQKQVWIENARRQIGVLEGQKAELEASIAELRNIYDTVISTGEWPEEV